MSIGNDGTPDPDAQRENPLLEARLDAPLDVPLDAPLDAHLREALRHAPDADTGPPPGLSHAILRQARQATATAASTAPTPTSAHGTARTPHGSARKRAAVKPRATPGLSALASRWSALWSWLMQAPVAAGFASLMVATLVGVMWWGRPMDEALHEALAPEAAAPPAPVSAPVTAAAPRAEAPVPNMPQKADSARVAQPAAPQGAVDQRERLKERAAGVAPLPSRSPAISPTPTPTPTQANGAAAAKKAAMPAAQTALPSILATERERKAESVLADERRPGAAPLAKSSVTAVEQPRDVATGATAAPAAAPSATPPQPFPATPPEVAAASPTAERRRDDETVARTEQRRTTARDAAASAPNAAAPSLTATLAPAAGGQLAAKPLAQARGSAGETADRNEAATANLRLTARAASEPAQSLTPAENPVARVRAAVAAWPEVWTWQRGGGAEQPMNDALQAWLAQLDEATRSRWQASSMAANGSTTSVRLLRNGRLQATVRIDAGAVRVEAAGGSSTAATGGATAAALRSALDQATP